ncbi:MAG: HD domain-containing protein [Acidobacteriota bacterium]
MPFVRDNDPIATWNDGDFARGFALVSRRESRRDRNGREYLDVELSDASGAITGKVWPDNEAVRGAWKQHDFVAFQGTVKKFRDQLQLNLDQVRKITDADRDNGFDEALLIPSSPEDLDQLWARLTAIYPAQIERPVLRQLAERVLEREGERLRVHPAARSIHHAYRGGLLEHTTKMAELALDLCRHYPQADRDIVLLGVLLHDLGKIREIGAMPVNDYTVEGHLVGHVVLGRDLLLECCATIEGFPANLRLHLEHVVLAHQGRREYGSPTEPATIEAYVVHFVDNIDSKISQLREAKARAGDESFYYVRGLDRYTYLKAPGE